MFQLNDVVVYGAQGVCRITGTQERKVDGITRQYYVLKPVDPCTATYYVPTGNAAALSKIRHVMSRQEAQQLLASLADQAPDWIPNETQRRETYRSILAQGDRAALLSMIRALSRHKAEREAEGKRMHVSDDRFLKDARQLLFSELQYVLDMDPDRLSEYML